MRKFALTAATLLAVSSIAGAAQEPAEDADAASASAAEITLMQECRQAAEASRMTGELFDSYVQTCIDDEIAASASEEKG